MIRSTVSRPPRHRRARRIDLTDAVAVLLVISPVVLRWYWRWEARAVQRGFGAGYIAGVADTTETLGDMVTERRT